MKISSSIFSFLSGIILLLIILRGATLLGFSAIRVMILMVPIAVIILAVIYWDKVGDYLIVVLSLGAVFLAGLFYEETWEIVKALGTSVWNWDTEAVIWGGVVVFVIAILIMFAAKASDSWKGRSDSFFGLIYQIIYLVFGWGTLAFLVGAAIGIFFC